MKRFPAPSSSAPTRSGMPAQGVPWRAAAGTRALLITVVGFLLLAPIRARAQYFMENLGDMGGMAATAVAINDGGTAAGSWLGP